MDENEFRAFLHDVATDADLRNQIESNPIPTLAARGITIVASDVPEGGVHLPSSEEILAMIDELAQKFSQGALCESHVGCFLWVSH
jgi:hypothetical protein